MKILIKVITWLSFIFLVFLLGFFLLRNSLLSKAVSTVTEKFKNEKGVLLTVREASFKSFFNIEIKDVSVCSPESDTIVTLDSVLLSPRISALLKGEIEFSDLELFGPTVSIFKNANCDNITFLFRNDELKKDTLSRGNLANSLSRLFELFYDQIPDNFSVSGFHFYADVNDKVIQFEIPSAIIKSDHFNVLLKFPADSISADFLIKGRVDRGDHQIEGRMYSESKNNHIPFFQKYYDLKLKADTISFSIRDFEGEKNSLGIKGNISATGFLADNWRIAPEPVKIHTAGLEYSIFVSGDSVFMDSSSTARINRIVVHPYLALKRGKNKTYTIDLKIPEIKADSFFSSLPEGIFDHVRNIRANGYLSYKLYFRYDEAKPDSLDFSSQITKKDFKITSFGKTDPRKLNGEFSYTAYEKGKPMRSFPVGPSNASFTPFEAISPYLVSSVMTSEDGNFFYHNGFNANAFRSSIIENIKERRFKRGGSTISMQLVKNVFLTRNKNISRKVEEALLTWLIESNRLVPKQRMLEVYLNIIEWGPNVYGIGEASHFYFSKSPSALDLNESIFLAMIVPQPKGFRYHFNEQGHLKEHCQAYYNLLARHLVKKSIITEEQQLNLIGDVKLTGPAAGMVKIVSDSTQIEEPEMRELVPETQIAD